MNGAQSSPVVACLMIALATAAWAACGQAPHNDEHHNDAPQDTCTVHSELRPTDEADPAGYEGAPTDSVLSPDGFVRVWWATDGPHSPPPADSNDSGVPDYVELTAAIADEVGATIEAGGWRRPLTSLSDTAADPQPLDLFLVDFSAGDGQYRAEECGLVDGTPVCAGHLRVENDFRFLAYPSHEYALRVVVAHEYFHAVQNAYHAEFPPWWAEGGATWFQEYFWDEQSDFERLAGQLLDDPGRSLHDRQRGPFDGFAYGASLFAYFLELQMGAPGIREIDETIGSSAVDVDVIGAIDEVLQQQWVPLEDAFPLFAVYNLFTGSRAIDAAGYPEAQRFEEVDLLDLSADQSANWEVAVDPLATSYARIDGARDLSLAVEGLDNFGPLTALATSAADFEAHESVVLLGEEPVNFDAQKFPLYLVVANPDSSEEGAIRVRLRGAVEPSEEEHEEDPSDLDPDESEQDDQDITEDLDDDQESSGCATTGSGEKPPLVVFVIVGLGLLRLRRPSPKRISCDAL